MHRQTLRIALVLAATAVAVVSLIAGAGDGEDAPEISSGSTVEGVWADLDGNGTLERGPGEPLAERTELAPASPASETLGTLVQVTDPHVRDEESPARASLLDRLDPALNSAFRPQESLSTQVLAGVVDSVNDVAPDAVLLTGDLADSAQENELTQFLATVAGGTVEPDSGGAGYEGPQASANPDPFFYRPDLDAPRHPGLLDDAQEEFESPGLEVPWFPLVGNHDLLVQGEVVPTRKLQELALGDRLLSGIDVELEVPERVEAELEADDSPELSPEVIDAVFARGFPGSTRRVSSDDERRYVSSDEALARLRDASGSGGEGPLMDYSFDAGGVRVIELDLVNRDGGSDGIVHPGQAEFLDGELERAGERPVIVVTHQPIDGAIGGEELLAILDRDPDVIATLSGDTHSNSIEPRRTPAGGYWQIGTSSLTDWPMQARAIRVVATEDGGIALETWMIDATGSELATTARELAYLDAQGGRPQGNEGESGDRNAVLYR